MNSSKAGYDSEDILSPQNTAEESRTTLPAEEQISKEALEKVVSLPAVFGGLGK